MTQQPTEAYREYIEAEVQLMELSLNTYFYGRCPSKSLLDKCRATNTKEWINCSIGCTRCWAEFIIGEWK